VLVTAPQQMLWTLGFFRQLSNRAPRARHDGFNRLSDAPFLRVLTCGNIGRPHAPTLEPGNSHE
jgi:hypothetical protein